VYLTVKSYKSFSEFDDFIEGNEYDYEKTVTGDTVITTDGLEVSFTNKKEFKKHFKIIE